MSKEQTYTIEVNGATMEFVDGERFGVVLKADGVALYNASSPIRWERVTAPTVGRAWKAPVYMGSDGQEFVDFNNQIEIEWNEEI